MFVGWGRRGAVLGSVAAFALVAELLVAVPAQADEGPDYGAVPPLTSDAVDPAVPTTPEESSLPAVGGDFKQAPAGDPEDAPAPFGGRESKVSDSFDPEESVLVDQSEFQDVYLNEDGTKTAVIAPEPVNVEQGDGSFEEVATTVVKRQDGDLEPGAHPLSPVFADTAADGDVFTVTRGGFTMSTQLVGASDSKAVRRVFPWSSTPANVVRYPDVFPGTDLTYEVTAGSVKEELVLSDVPTKEHDSWTWNVTAPGLTASVDEEGTVVFADEAGSMVFGIPAPVMFDSSGVEGERTDAEAMVPLRLARPPRGGRSPCPRSGPG